MSFYIDSLLLCLLGVFLFPSDKYALTYFTGFLILFAMYCFISAYETKVLHLICTVVSCGIALLLPELTLFLPLICYVEFHEHDYTLPAICVIPLGYYFLSGQTTPSLMILLIFVLSFYLAHQRRQHDMLRQRILTFRDDSVEKEMNLKQQNRQILENQDSQVHIATLQERNRIAREIHDNVGHMLSRSILQVGAMIAICKDETLKPHLSSLKETLDTAMTSIRSSVHDLHDESVDLSQALHNLADNFSFCEISLDCELSKQIPKDVKYAFLAITKEALNNTMKHSNATKVSVTVKEHPGFYQLLIEDNGTGASSAFVAGNTSAGGPPSFNARAESGIGLSNMQQRVDALGGILHITTDNGFRIFVSVPKK